jgi:hypothetical protein
MSLAQPRGETVLSPQLKALGYAVERLPPDEGD